MNITEEECRNRMGEWVKSYKKKDRTIVHGYCKNIRIFANINYPIKNDEDYEIHRRLLQKELQAQRNFINNYQDADDL